MKILYKVQFGKDIHSKVAMSYNRELYQIFFYIIDKGFSQGQFHSDLSIDEISKHLIMAYRGLVYEWCALYPDFDLKEQALQHFEILMKGI